jgi:hypothetical protein
MEEISSVLWDTTELISSVTYFLRKLPKSRRYTLKCVTRPPAAALATGHTTFPKVQKTGQRTTGSIRILILPAQNFFSAETRSGAVILNFLLVLSGPGSRRVRADAQRQPRAYSEQQRTDTKTQRRHRHRS